MEFVLENWDTIIEAIVTIALVIVFTIRGQKSKIKEIFSYLVTEAEVKYGSGTGILKKSEVISKMYGKLPAFISTLIPKSVLVKWMEEALSEIKSKWESNPKLINSVDSKNKD